MEVSSELGHFTSPGHDFAEEGVDGEGEECEHDKPKKAPLQMGLTKDKYIRYQKHMNMNSL